MRNFERAFRAVVPPGGDAPKPSKDGSKERPQRSVEHPYVVIGEQFVSYLGVEVPKGQGGRLVPGAAEFKEEYFYLKGHYQLMRDVASALLLNKPILIEGGTGVYNKTTTIAKMCRDLNMNYCKINFDRETAREDVIGGQTIKVDEQGNEKLEWYDGDLMYAIRHGGVAFLDEYNRQGKLAGIINPIIDAILNGRKEISNPYNENERVRVHPDFRLVAAQNPPGMEEGQEYTDRSQLPAETFGRWIYKKIPNRYSEEEENELLAGMIGEEVSIDLPETEYRRTGEGIPVIELAQIPGMEHWRKQIVTILRLLEEKSSGAKREFAKGQRQNIYFNPRLKKTIIDYIARFYTGDINETVTSAFELCVVNMYRKEEDKVAIRTLLDTAKYVPVAAQSKRKGLKREPKQPPVGSVEGESEAVFARKREELDTRARRARMELAGGAATFSPEHLHVLDAIFGAGNLDVAEIPSPEEITPAYFDIHYPVRTTKEREADLKKGLVNFRPDWFSKDADASLVGPRPEKWMDAYIRSMKHEAQELSETAQTILSESIQQPNYIDSSQQYGTLEGRESGKDWLIPIMKQCFGETANRFNHSHDELTASFGSEAEKKTFIEERLKEYKAKSLGTYTFNRRTLQSPLALAHHQIEKSFADKGLPAPNFRVILEPATIFNRQTREKHKDNSMANTWGWSSTILRGQGGEDSGNRLFVGSVDGGGAGDVDDVHRDDRSDYGGFRLAVVLEK